MRLDAPIKKQMRRIDRIRKRMSFVKVGLPKKVTFEYYKGTVTSFPKEKKWVVEPKGKKPIIHIFPDGQRNDVTKHKARHLLKLAILKLLRNDG